MTGLKTQRFQLASQSVWTLGFHGTQDSDLVQYSDWAMRLYVSADKMSRALATSFDWHQSHRSSAATSCLASAVPGKDTREYR